MAKPSDAQLAAAFARTNLLAYAIGAPGSYEVARMHRHIGHALERIESGALRRLMIFAPPRHGKTRLASQFFPAWFLGRRPGRQVMACSYNETYAEDNGRATRNLCIDPYHAGVFGSSVRTDSRSVTRFHTTNGGLYVGTSVGGTLTGRGADLLLIDDPIKGDASAASETVRESQKTWYARDARTRLMPGGAVVVIMTRWHEDDLCGWLLRESSEPWEVLRLPALAEKDDPLGRKEGEALWPERFPVAELEAQRQGPGMGSAWWALFQQRPQPEGGGIFKAHWFKRWRRAAPPADKPNAWIQLPTRYDRIVISWDCSFKGTAKSDFVVGQVWGVVGARMFLLDQVRGRWDFTVTLAEVQKLAARFASGREILIEDKANGSAVVTALETKLRGVIAVNPQGGKEARANAIAPLVEAGNVVVPDDTEAEWMPAWRAEVRDFPSGVNDDQVDAMTQALVRLNVPAAPRGIITAWPGL